jgi:hypothetical protein
MNGQGAAHGRWWVDRCNVRVLGQSAQDRWCQVEARYAISYPKEFTRGGRKKLANGSLSVLAVLLQMKGDGLARLLARCVGWKRKRGQRQLVQADDNVKQRRRMLAVTECIND